MPRSVALTDAEPELRAAVTGAPRVIVVVPTAGLAESPITYIDRQFGKSKISRRIVLEALFETTGIGVRRWVGHT